MTTCVFCAMTRDDSLSENIIYRDSLSVGFLDVHPKAPGHTLIVPKRHVVTLGELNSDEVGPFFMAVQKLAERLVQRLGAHGLTVGINQGKAAGQAILHLHVHLLPRFENDGGGSIHSIVNNIPTEPLVEMAQKLKMS